MSQTHPTFVSRKSIAPDDAGWVIDAVWLDHPAVRLIGVFDTKRHANAWIKNRSGIWPTNGDYPSAKRSMAKIKWPIIKSILPMVMVLIFSISALAQTPSPKVGAKPLVQVKPPVPMGCKLVGTVRGTKLWAGDCVANDLRGSSIPTGSLPSAEEKK